MQVTASHPILLLSSSNWECFPLVSSVLAQYLYQPRVTRILSKLSSGLRAAARPLVVSDAVEMYSVFSDFSSRMCFIVPVVPLAVTFYLQHLTHKNTSNLFTKVEWIFTWLLFSSIPKTSPLVSSYFPNVVVWMLRYAMHMHIYCYVFPRIKC